MHVSASVSACVCVHLSVSVCTQKIKHPDASRRKKFLCPDASFVQGLSGKDFWDVLYIFLPLFVSINVYKYNEYNITVVIQDLKNIKNVKRCRDGMPKSMQTR